MRTSSLPYRSITFGLLFLAATAFPSLAHAQLEGTYQVIIKKQEEKKRSRWTLAEWLTLKQRNKAMDLWLAQNSHSSTFEFFLEGTNGSAEQTLSSAPDSPSTITNYGAELGISAGVLGLRGLYEMDSTKRTVTSGSLNLRLFGQATQDTHLNLEYGIRGQKQEFDTQPSESFQSQFGGVELAIYLTKHFGVEGSYKKLLPATSDRDRSLEGEDSQASVFVDFSFVRVFGTWKKEFQRFEQGGATSTESREGLTSGLRFFF